MLISVIVFLLFFAGIGLIGMAGTAHTIQGAFTALVAGMVLFALSTYLNPATHGWWKNSGCPKVCVSQTFVLF